jgi:flagellar motor switch protein FliN/FliY
MVEDNVEELSKETSETLSEESVSASEDSTTSPEDSGGRVAQDAGGQEVQNVLLGQLDGETQPAEGRPKADLDLIMDVEVPVSVELGRTEMPIGQILELGPGSIVELEKMASDPVDLYVNNKLIARGEVVVADENFGIRITSVVDPKQRVKTLG